MFYKQLLELKQKLLSLFGLQLLEVASQENRLLKVHLTVTKKTKNRLVSCFAN